MIELLIAVFTGGGAMGLGSIIKIGAGFLDAKAATTEIKAKQELLREASDAETAKIFQDSLTGDTEGGLFSRHTRRMLALIGVLTLSICTIYCTILCDFPFITLPSIATGEGLRTIDLFFFSIPLSENPIELTLGHLAASNYIALNMIFGFYFTPGGRK